MIEWNEEANAIKAARLGANRRFAADAAFLRTLPPPPGPALGMLLRGFAGVSCLALLSAIVLRSFGL